MEPLGLIVTLWLCLGGPVRLFLWLLPLPFTERCLGSSLDSVWTQPPRKHHSGKTKNPWDSQEKGVRQTISSTFHRFNNHDTEHGRLRVILFFVLFLVPLLLHSKGSASLGCLVNTVHSSSLRKAEDPGWGLISTYHWFDLGQHTHLSPP